MHLYEQRADSKVTQMMILMW